MDLDIHKSIYTDCELASDVYAHGEYIRCYIAKVYRSHATQHKKGISPNQYLPVSTSRDFIAYLGTSV